MMLRKQHALGNQVASPETAHEILWLIVVPPLGECRN
jgi:hypothetical protein